MAIKKNKLRNAITLTKIQWEDVEKEAEKRGISKSKLVEHALKRIKVIK